MRSLDGRTVASGSAGANLSPVTCEELNPPAKSRINHWFSGESRAVSWGAPNYSFESWKLIGIHCQIRIRNADFSLQCFF